MVERRSAHPAKRRVDSASPRRPKPAGGWLGACRPRRGEIGAQLLAQTFNARVERGASRVPVECVPYLVDLGAGPVQGSAPPDSGRSVRASGLLRLSGQTECANAARLQHPDARGASPRT